jgi:hypothetical protein
MKEIQNAANAVITTYFHALIFGAGILTATAIARHFFNMRVFS